MSEDKAWRFSCTGKSFPEPGLWPPCTWARFSVGYKLCLKASFYLSGLSLLGRDSELPIVEQGLQGIWKREISAMRFATAPLIERGYLPPELTGSPVRSSGIRNSPVSLARRRDNAFVLMISCHLFPCNPVRSRVIIRSFGLPESLSRIPLVPKGAFARYSGVLLKRPSWVL